MDILDETPRFVASWARMFLAKGILFRDDIITFGVLEPCEPVELLFD